MISLISHILTGLGLASASGLNAYIPLLIVALTARFTDIIKLPPPFDILTNEFVIGALVVLLAIEVVVDKIPAADTVNDLFQTFVRPTAGAILFAASTNTVNVHPVVAVILGLIMAFSVHTVKATARPVVTATTMGVGNPVVSMAEDVASAIMAILAIVAPLVAVVVFAIIFAFVLRWWFGRRVSPRNA
jgi:hypothetical protein